MHVYIVGPYPRCPISPHSPASGERSTWKVIRGNNLWANSSRKRTQIKRKTSAAWIIGFLWPFAVLPLLFGVFCPFRSLHSSPILAVADCYLLHITYSLIHAHIVVELLKATDNNDSASPKETNKRSMHVRAQIYRHFLKGFRSDTFSVCV